MSTPTFNNQQASEDWKRQERMAQFAEIESRIDVNSLYWRGVQIWPYLRSRIWGRMTWDLADTIDGGLAADPIAEELKRGKALEGKSDFQKGSLDCRQYCVEKKIGLFFSRPQDHSDSIEGSKVNRHLDPLIDFCQPKMEIIKWELLNGDVKGTLPRHVATMFEETASLCHHFEHLKKEQVSITSQIIAFVEVVKAVTGYAFNLSYIDNQVLLLKAYEAFFYERLKQLNPHVVFLVCFYDHVPMALIRACGRLGIRTVEVQHGKQGVYHGMYTHWHCMPDEGYELMPDKFWCWGDETQKNINHLRPDNYLSHEAIVGGSRWLADWVDHDYFAPDEEAQVFYKTFSSYRHVVLFSMQPLLDPLFPEMIKAMQAAGDDTLWLCRLHPSQKRNMTEYMSRLKVNGIKSFEMEIASAVPLYALLRRCNSHVTGFSSVCYEALAFDVPTALVHPVGIELYRPYIDKKLFWGTLEHEQILSFVQREFADVLLEEDRPFIAVSDDLAQAALDRILC